MNKTILFMLTALLCGCASRPYLPADVQQETLTAGQTAAATPAETKPTPIIDDGAAYQEYYREGRSLSSYSGAPPVYIMPSYWDGHWGMGVGTGRGGGYWGRDRYWRDDYYHRGRYRPSFGVSYGRWGW